MIDSDLATKLHNELISANLRSYGIKREGNTVYIVYDDSRVDDEKLNPIKDKYHQHFRIRTTLPPDTKDLIALGFTPESIGENRWKDLEFECEIVEFKLKE